MMFNSLCMYYVKKKFEKINESNKKKCNILSMFLTHFFLVKKNYDMCFDNLIKFYASNHYYITQTI
jgi:hypothetical protein